METRVLTRKDPHIQDGETLPLSCIGMTAVPASSQQPQLPAQGTHSAQQNKGWHEDGKLGLLQQPLSWAPVPKHQPRSPGCSAHSSSHTPRRDLTPCRAALPSPHSETTHAAYLTSHPSQDQSGPPTIPTGAAGLQQGL